MFYQTYTASKALVDNHRNALHATDGNILSLSGGGGGGGDGSAETRFLSLVTLTFDLRR